MESLQSLISQTRGQPFGTEISSEPPRKGYFGMTTEEREAQQREIGRKMQEKATAYNKSDGDLEGYDCMICRNRGFFMEIVPMNGTFYDKLRPCECMKTRKSMNHMQRSGLSDFLREKTFRSFETKTQRQLDIKTKAIEYAKNPDGHWFFIGGKSGIGKTHICSAIYSALICRGLSPQYFRWREDINRIKSAVNDYDIYGELVNKLKYCDLLYLDDFFWTGRTADGRKAMPTTADMNFAFEILDYRYLHKNKITVISSELNIADLLGVDEAIAGRIVERCGNYCLSLGENSMRNYRTQSMFTEEEE